MASAHAQASSRRDKLRSAVVSVVESLERRQMFAAAPAQIGINYGPWASEAETGYLTDSGEVYRTQQFGLDYGWQSAITSGNTYERSASKPQKLETGVVTTTSNSWKIKLEAGTYVVKLVAGDANITSGTYKYNLSTTVSTITNFLNGTAGTGDARWASATGEITVGTEAGSENDKDYGWLTIIDNGGTQHRLAHVDIVRKDAKDAPGNPAPPESVVATARLSTWVDLRWVDNSAENFDDGFQIERKTIVNGTVTATSTITEGGGIRQLYSDYTRSANTTYEYRVRAVRTTTGGSVRYSDWSSPVQITTPANDNQSAYGPANWSVPTVNSSTGLVEPLEAENYDKGGPSVAYGDSVGSNAGGFYRGGSVDVGLFAPENTYFVGWIDTNDWQEYTANIATTGTYYVDALVASNGTGGTWKLQQNGSDKITGIQVKDTGGWHQFEWQSSTTTSQLTAGTGQVLRFWATAKDASGKFVGNFDSFRILRFDAPSALSATAVSSGRMDLNWTSNATAPDAYVIERKLGAGGSWAEIATIAGSQTSYSDTDPTLQAGSTYFYQVRARRQILGAITTTYDFTAYSGTANGILPNPTQVPSASIGLTGNPSGANVALSWTDTSSTESGFYILRKLASANWPSDPIPAYATVGANVTSYNDTTTSPATSYHYKVVAYNAAGRSADSNQVTVTTSSSSVSTLNPTADTYVRDGTNASNSYGTQGTVEAKAGSGYTRQAFIKFDLTGLSGTVNDAVLRVYGKLNTADNVPIVAKEVADNTWTESINWSTKPTMGATIDQQTITSTGNVWHEFDLTPYVSAAIAANQTTLTVGLTGVSSSSAYLSFTSREDPGNTGKKPELLVTTTVSGPQVPASLAAAAIQSSKINVSWASVPGVTGYKVERSIDGVNFSQLADVTTPSVVDIGRSPGTLYYYRVRAYSGSTNGAYATAVSATTYGAPILNAPTGKNEGDAVMMAVTFGNPVPTVASHSWTVTRNGQVYASGTNSNIQFTPDNDGSYVVTSTINHTSNEVEEVSATVSVGNVAPSLSVSAAPTASVGSPYTLTLSAADPGAADTITWTIDWGDGTPVINPTGRSLTPSHTYATAGSFNISISASDGSSTSYLSPATLGVTVETAPAAPSDLSRIVPPENAIRIGWIDNSINETGFEVQRRPIGGTWSNLTPNNLANDFDFDDDTYNPSEDSEYQVRAINVAGVSDWSNALQIPAKPAVPTVSVNGNAVVLTWSDVSSIETGYRVERSTDGMNFISLNAASLAQASAGTATFADSTSLIGTNYFYRVRAVGESAEGLPSTSVAQEGAVDLSAPSNLSASFSGTDVTLTWVDNSDGETAFVIERASDSTFSAPVPLDPVTSTSCVDQPGLGTWWYRVKAVIDTAETSAWSSSTNVTVLSAPNAPTNATFTLPSSIQALLTWDAASGDPEEYYIYASVDGGDFELHDIVPAQLNSYRYFSLTTASVQFKLSAVNDGGESALVDMLGPNGTAAVTIAGSTPAAPTGLGVSGTAYTDGVPLNWTASPDATGYLIQWSNGDGDWFTIGEVTGTSYLDELPVLGDQQYRIVAQRGTLNPQLSQPSQYLLVRPIAPPVAWYDDNGGPNDRGTLSKWSVSHSDSDGIEVNVVPDDVDYDNGPLSIPSFADGGFEQPADNAGTVTLNAQTGGFTFVPNSGFVGTAKFRYRVTDGSALSEWATVAVDVTNSRPTVQNQHIVTDLPARDWIYDSASNTYEWKDWSTTLDLLSVDSDTDSLRYEIVEEPEFGTVNLNQTTGRFTYTADGTSVAFDKFKFSVTDEVSEPVEAWFTVERNIRAAGSTEQHFYLNTYQLPEDFQSSPYASHIGSLAWKFLTPPQNGTIYVRERNASGQLMPRAVADPNRWYTGLDVMAAYQPNAGATTDFYEIQLPGLIKPKSFHVSIVDGDYPPPTYSAGHARHYVSAVVPTVLSNQQTLFSAANEIAVAQQASFGVVTVTPEGGITYTPTIQADQDPFLGWDFVKLSAKHPYASKRSDVWVQFEVGGYVPPPPPSPLPPEEQWQPETFDGSLTQLWQKYILAKDQSRIVLEHLVPVGQLMLDAENAASDAERFELIDDLDAALEAARAPFELYVQKHVDAKNAAEQFMKDTWFLTQAKIDVHTAIMKLPVDFAGLKATKDQFQRYKAAFDGFGDAAGVQVDTAATIVTVAETSKNVLDVATVVLGGGVLIQAGTKLTMAGIRLYSEQGVAALAKAAIPVATKVGVGVGVSYAVSSAENRARELGLSETQIGLIKIAANSTQLIPAMKAAKLKAALTPAKPFKAPLNQIDGSKLLKFPGVTAQSRTFTLRPQADVTTMRNAFDATNGPKEQFLKNLANNHAASLRKAGIPEPQINRMKEGYVPVGFDVHHKTPLKFGGDNDPANLMLMQTGASDKVNYHGAITNYQNSLARGLPDGTTFETQWPSFDKWIYP